VIDLLLAIVHHLLAFGIAAAVTAELVLVRPGMQSSSVRLAARYDAAYGLFAVGLLVIGFLRVFFGVKGSGYYFHNHIFLTKVGLFLVMGLLSIKPTLRMLGWRKALQSDPGFVPAEGEIKAVRKSLMAEIHVFAFIPIAAAAMARGYGYVA